MNDAERQQAAEAVGVLARLKRFLAILQETDALMRIATDKLKKITATARLTNDATIIKGVNKLNADHVLLAQKQVYFNKYIIGIMKRFGMLKESASGMSGYQYVTDMGWVGPAVALGVLGLGIMAIAAYIYAHRSAVLKHARDIELAEKELDLVRRGGMDAQDWLTRRYGVKSFWEVLLSASPYIVGVGGVVALVMLNRRYQFIEGIKRIA